MNPPANNEASPNARLTAARLKQWHQQGEALLTIENARSFLNATGLVLFAPRPQIASPAPSFVEAVLGQPGATPSLAQTAQAKEVLARLVAEGLAVPLNLLGVGSVIGQPAAAPDFIASAQVFSYIFTLRGDKGWKQPPQSAGPAKFSNLATAAHELLAAGGPLTAYDLARELGNEVTESAALRALGELWSHLRVIPLPQLDGRATLWELATARLTKQIKAGANAGQPTALSALISLYLGQAIVASEDEIESFLSPLAARSRIREVVHALVAARQLDTVVIEGRTMLHIAGAALEFLNEEMPTTPDAQEEDDALDEVVAAEAEAAEIAEGGEIEAEPGSRIAKFVPKRKPAERELAKAKPVKSARSVYVDKRKSSGEARKPFGEKRPFASREGRERLAFRDGKSSRPFSERSSFQRPERTGERAERPRRFESEGRAPFEKKRFASRDGESRPRFERHDRETERPERERRPFVREDRGGERPLRRFSGREGTGGGREERRPFSRPGAGRDTRSERPARKPFDRPAGKREFASREDRPRREFKPRSFEGRKPFDGPKKSFDRPKPFGRRPDSGKGGEENGASRGFDGKRPFTKSGGFGKKPGGFSRPFRGKERREDRGEGAARDGAGFGGKKFGSDRPRGTRPDGPGGRFGEKKFGARPGGAKFGGKPGGSKFGPKKFGAKKPFGKPSGPRGPKPSRPKGDAEA